MTDQVMVTGKRDSDFGDLLITTLTKSFANFGQDTNKPEVQAQVQAAATRLREINPDSDDKQLAQQVAANLPAAVNAAVQSKKDGYQSGVDEKQQLAEYNAQKDKDAQTALSRERFAPVVWGQNYNMDKDKYTKESVDNSFILSGSIKDKMDRNKETYVVAQERGKADEQAARARSESEKATQEGVKTTAATREEAIQQQYIDPKSQTSTAMRASLKAQLTAMGISPAAIALMDNMAVPQMKMFAENAAKTEKEKTDIAKTVQEAKTSAAQATANLASANASNAQAGASNAQAEGFRAEARTKRVDAEIAEKSTEGYRTGQTTSLEGAPKATFEKFSTAGSQNAYTANNKLLDGMNAASSDRADTVQQIDQTMELLKSGYTGPWSKQLAVITPRLQQIQKNLAGLEAKQQVGQSTAAGSMAAAAATPDILKDPTTLRVYLATLKSQLQRQESVATSMGKARTNNTLSTFDVNREAMNTKSFVLPGGKIITLSPQDIKEGAMDQVVKLEGKPMVEYHGGK